MNISLDADHSTLSWFQSSDRSEAKYSELDVSVDAAVINLVPPTFNVIGPVKGDMVCFKKAACSCDRVRRLPILER